MIIKKRTLISTLIMIFITGIGVIGNSIAVCKICVLFLFVTCILKGMQEKYFLNPYYMFSFVPFTLLIYLKISDYHLELTVNTYLIAIINIVAFIMAMDITPEYKNIIKCKGAGEERQLVNNTIILLVLGFLPMIYTTLSGRSMPLASVISLFSSGAILCALKSRKKGLILFVSVCFLASWIGYVSKSSVLTFAIAMIVGYEKYYVQSTKQRKKLIVLAVVGVILMILAFSFANQGRSNASGQVALDYYTKYGGVKWNGKTFLFMPYMYLTTPWTNLQYVMETQNTHTYGLWMIRPLLGYFQIDGIFESFYEMRSYSNFNTFTYIACCFKDFGFWGSCISSAFLGFFTKKVYSRYKLSKSPLDVTCYVLLGQAVLEMFFSNHFYTQSYPFTIVIIMGIYKMLFCKKNKPEIEQSYIE